MVTAIRRATSLRPGQFRHLIRVASVTGRMPERDVPLLWLTHTTGIRVTELALLEVADVLYPSGTTKPEVYLRADITKGCRPRNVYLTHARCLAALDDWIAVRSRRRWGLSSTDEYRGCGLHRSWSRHTRARFLNWPSSIGSWTVGQRFTGRAIRSNRPSAGSTDRPVSRWDHPTVADARLLQKSWPQPATLRQFRSFSGMPVSTTASCI